MKAEQAKNSLEVVNLMNKALKLGPSSVVHHPRVASQLKDAEARKLAPKLGDDPMGYMDIVSSAGQGLDGKPVWAYDPFPDWI